MAESDLRKSEVRSQFLSQVTPKCKNSSKEKHSFGRPDYLLNNFYGPALDQIACGVASPCFWVRQNE